MQVIRREMHYSLEFVVFFGLGLSLKWVIQGMYSLGVRPPICWAKLECNHAHVFEV